jgi:hypothetical protein
MAKDKWSSLSLLTRKFASIYPNPIPDMKTITRKERLMKALDERVNARLIALSKKYPQICVTYLEKMHKIIDWAEKELSDIENSPRIKKS